MDDTSIVELYWLRSETAITETASKYGRYCYAIAYSILHNPEDADESVNDTYLGAWNSMPPHRPSMLSSFLGKITRRISINKWQKSSADKRGGGEINIALDELCECVPTALNTEQAVQVRELVRAINSFLRSLSPTERDVFVCRYWLLVSIKDISEKFGFGQSKVKTMLHRTRKRLQTYLQEEGF